MTVVDLPGAGFMMMEEAGEIGVADAPSLALIQRRTVASFTFNNSATSWTVR